MNYDKIYTSIIQNRKSNPATGYTEEHHILPKCLFPQYKNLKEHSWNGVRLTAREHFICHQLLVKIYNHFGLTFSANKMSNSKKHSSRIYSWLRVKVSKMLSEKYKGRKLSQETKEKMSKSRKGRKLSEQHRKNSAAGQIGKIVTEETKQKIRDKRKLQIITEETKLKMSKTRKGKPKSEEWKKKISESCKRSKNKIKQIE